MVNNVGGLTYVGTYSLGEPGRTVNVDMYRGPNDELMWMPKGSIHKPHPASLDIEPNQSVAILKLHNPLTGQIVSVTIPFEQPLSADSLDSIVH